MKHVVHYHNWLFLFGFIYYLIIPLVVVCSNKWEDYPGIDNIYLYFKNRYIYGYLTMVILLGLFFLLGSYTPRLCKLKTQMVYCEKIVPSKHFVLLVSPLLLYCQYVIFQNRSYLFQGYLVELESPFVGTIATTSLFVLFIYLYNKIGIYSKTVDKLLVFFIIEMSIVLLGLGTRMYVIIPIISIFIYLIENKKISLKRLFTISGFVILFILAVGIWRMGDKDISIDALLYIGIAEPSLTWISAISLYDLNEIPLLLFPKQFLSSYINFLPSTLFPNKSELIASLPLKYDNPLGATSLYTSLIANFGLFGSFLAIFLFGFLLTFIRLRWRTNYGRAYYYCICGIIPFQLFRDSVEIINKELFFTFLILPCLFILFSNKRKIRFVK